MDEGPRILLDSKGRRFWIPPATGARRVEGLGVVDPERLRGLDGQKVVIGGQPFLVLRPSAMDLLTTLHREAQTIGPKDLASILLHADIGPGCRVIEGGCGTGSLTLALARAVGPSGAVISFDRRREALATAQTNVERAGLASVVRFREGDVRTDLGERDADAVLLDIPDPWAAVDPAWTALRPCGHLATFSPNMEQVKETVRAVGKKPFVEVRTIELIERELEVRDAGVRPSFAPLGHTGYLTFARKVLDTF